MTTTRDTIGLYAQLACIWEATARKPGNVHRFCDFDDTGYVDFLSSAAAIAPVLAEACNHSVGATVLEAVQRTRQVARANTNLGIILLLAPLAKADSWPDGRASVAAVLEALTIEDAELAYQAILLAGAGGLGQMPEQDVRGVPTVTLREAMALAADRDLIARQYVNGFAEVFEQGAPAVLAGIERTGCLEGGIVHTYLHLMSSFPDTLIARKRGAGEAEESARRAAEVLAAGWPETPAGRAALAELDDWLRAEGHQRNPGTTADLIAASLFVLLRQMRLRLPLKVPWTRSEMWPVEW
jgi:triphosphoribosyl-dephospho-CoA synthase